MPVQRSTGKGPGHAAHAKNETPAARREREARERQKAWEEGQRERSLAAKDRQRFASAMRITLPVLCEMHEQGKLPATSAEVMKAVHDLGSRAKRKFERWGQLDGVVWDLRELQVRKGMVGMPRRLVREGSGFRKQTQRDREMATEALMQWVSDLHGMRTREPWFDGTRFGGLYWDLSDNGRELVDSGFAQFVRGKNTAGDVLKARGGVKKATKHFTKRVKERLWHPQGKLVAKMMEEPK